MSAVEPSIVNLPLLLIGGLLLGAAVAYLFRAWEQIVALSASMAVAMIGVLLWRVDLAATADNPTATAGFVGSQLSRFGFNFGLDAAALPGLILSFAFAAIGLLLAARISQGRGFPAVTLTLLAGYSVLYLLRTAPISPVLVLPLGFLLLSCITAIGLQAGRVLYGRGPLRWMIAPTLAFPLFIVAKWYIDQAPLNPQDDTPLRIAASLMSFGLLLLMAPTPLHSMQPVSAESAPPVATSLFSLLYQLALIAFVVRVLVELPFMQELSPMTIWFSWAGIVTAIWAGLAALGANHPGRLWGYAALYDWGLIILLLSVPGLRTWSLVAFLFVLRAASMFTATTGLMTLEHHLGHLSLDALRGAGMRMPWNCAAFLLGGLGLVGFPLSAGFAGHWAALQLIAASDWRPAAAVLVASAGAIIAFIRQARVMFGPLVDPYLAREGAVGVVFAAVALMISVGLAIAPQLLNSSITRAIIAFSS